MYNQFANLSRRIAGAGADIEIAAKRQTALVQERDALLAKYVDDIEIGEHPVPGGKVVVTKLDNFDRAINFYEVDEATQKFADRYAVCCRNLTAEDARVVMYVNMRYAACKRQEECCKDFHNQLVDGDYVVVDGFVRVQARKAIFHANT